jgi:hypothetical protein
LVVPSVLHPEFLDSLPVCDTRLFNLFKVKVIWLQVQ